jgi:hypothetical protein
MEDGQNERFTDAELHAFFDRLFPHGFAGADVLAELAPDGWEQSSLLGCFHPSVEQRFAESVRLHHHLESLRDARRRHRGTTGEVPRPAPTLEDVRRDHQPTPVKVDEELPELMGLCLWDVFSDNHEVVASDGRVIDIGSFRGAGAFLDEHLTRGDDRWREGDYMRFYLGTIGIARRVDLVPVYTLIFRRLRALGGDWVFHFPQLYMTELQPAEPGNGQPAHYSVSESALAELKAQKRDAETARFRAEIEEANAQARDEALDREPPATVRAYRQVYGRDPRGWPPA